MTGNMVTYKGIDRSNEETWLTTVTVSVLVTGRGKSNMLQGIPEQVVKIRNWGFNNIAFS